MKALRLWLARIVLPAGYHVRRTPVLPKGAKAHPSGVLSVPFGLAGAGPTEPLPNAKAPPSS